MNDSSFESAFCRTFLVLLGAVRRHDASPNVALPHAYVKYFIILFLFRIISIVSDNDLIYACPVQRLFIDLLGGRHGRRTEGVSQPGI